MTSSNVTVTWLLGPTWKICFSDSIYPLALLLTVFIFSYVGLCRVSNWMKPSVNFDTTLVFSKLSFQFFWVLFVTSRPELFAFWYAHVIPKLVSYLLAFEAGGFSDSSAPKESTRNAGDLGSMLGSSPGEGKGYPLQYSGLENSTDFIVHGVAKSWTRLSDFHFAFWP